jgi:dolichol-phosphate mannosyltransferase
MELSVILPTYNEAENISEMARQLNRHIKPKEIIVVDDNSRDRTAEFARKAGKNVRVIVRKKERGVGSAIKRWIKEAKGGLVAWMDADLSMPPSLLPEMLKRLESGKADVVIASRYAKGGKDARGFARRLTSRALNLVAEIVLGYGIKDYDTGYVLAKREVLGQIDFNAEGHGEYCIEFLFKACRAGFKVKEVGFVFRDREKGQSKTMSSLLSYPVHGASYLWRIFSIRVGK